MTARGKRSVLAALLVLATLATYGEVVRFPLLHYDDVAYVSENPAVREGLTPSGIRWAFGAVHVGNWHPLTWLSHMLDVTLFGLDPAGHHATNLALHALVVVLLYGVLVAATGAPGPSAVVAALFGLHPQRVEVVAWVAERKELLAAAFALAGLAAWLRHARSGSRAAYAGALAAFAASLLSKASWVTFPFVLLLLDLWPLRRWPARRALLPPGLVIEKLPFFALALASCAITLHAQGIGIFWHVPLEARLANAALSGLRYLGLTLWPSGLSPVYPWDAELSRVAVALSLLLLAALTLAALVVVRRAPYLTVGWLWFLGTLVPMSGIVQVGHQAMADRYTYVPSIGLLVALVFGAHGWLAGRLSRTVQVAAGVLPALLLAVASHGQARYWSDEVALFQRALAVTADNYWAQNALGNALARRGEVARALPHYREALRLRPEWPTAHFALGTALLSSGRVSEALPHLQRAAAAPHPPPDAHYHLGVALEHLGRWPEAAASYAAEVERSPEHAEALEHLAVIRACHPDSRLRNGAEALHLAERALGARGAETAHGLDVLAAALAERGRLDEAERTARRARALAESSGDAAHARRIEERRQSYEAGRPVRLELAPPGASPG